ncbi:MAG: hypothetical protein Q8L78_07830 [Coxiellaceae bacterium]|nr:hypothetical protein [Coxiellaceae bacterium]
MMRHEPNDISSSDHTTSYLPHFTATNFSALSKNEYMRYCPSSDITGHVVISKDNGFAMQYKLPDGDSESPFAVDVSDLAHIALLEGKAVVTGKYGESQLVSRRSYPFSIQVDGKDPAYYEYYPLSPTKNALTREERPILYDAGSIERANNTDAAREKFRATPKKIKEGAWLVINNTDVPLRMISRRTPDQNTVMGLHHAEKMPPQERRGRKYRSAKEEVTESLEENSTYFSAEMVTALTKMANAPFRYADAKDPNYFPMEKQSYPEWLHRESHNLHPMDKDPQRADNLGAAEMRHNTAMMLGERTLQFFALHTPSSKNRLRGRFEMLLNTEVINWISLLTCTQIGPITVTLRQEIDPFPKYPQDAKPSDLAAFIGILHCMMQNIPPTSQQNVTRGAYAPSIQRHRFVRNTAPPLLLMDDSSEDDDPKPAQFTKR